MLMYFSRIYFHKNHFYRTHLVADSAVKYKIQKALLGDVPTKMALLKNIFAAYLFSAYILYLSVVPIVPVDTFFLEFPLVATSKT